MTDLSFEDSVRGIKRIRPRPKAGLTVEEVKNKTKGNYIFSFGFPGSGKTTFHWMMMNYLLNEGPFRTEVVIPTGSEGEDWEGRAIINAWKTQWIEGRFPDPTASAETDIREIQITTRATAGKKLNMAFSFLEASGELLQQVMPGPSSPPLLAPLLRAYLDNPRLKFCMILMLSPDVEENDQLFASFVAYLKNNFPGLLARMSLGVIVSKPEDSLRRLQEFGSSDGQMGYDRFSEDAIMAYMNRFCGETYQIWMDWPDPKKTLLCPLHLGDIETIEGEPRLVEPDFHHIEEVFFWMFEQFTKKRPGPTMWQSLTGRLDWT